MSLKTRLFLVAIIAIVIGTLLAQTGLVWVAMPVAFVGAGLCSLFIKSLKGESTTDIVLELIAALVGSQIAWSALLI